VETYLLVMIVRSILLMCWWKGKRID